MPELRLPDGHPAVSTHRAQQNPAQIVDGFNGSTAKHFAQPPPARGPGRNGASAACPADAKSTAVCRPAAGPCDVADSCNGMTDACPADAFVAAGTVCRASSGTCDVAEACTGSAAACPPNGGLPDTDGDALCDAIEPCTNVGGGRTMSGVNPIPKIVLNKINTDAVPNNDHLTLTGAFILPASADFSDLNPPRSAPASSSGTASAPRSST